MRTGPEIIEVHNCYTLYERNEDGSAAEKRMLCFSRPQDWGDPRWFHYEAKVEVLDSGVRFINHAHFWIEIERSLWQCLQGLGGYAFMVLHPGVPEKECGRDYLKEDDFWRAEWGEELPVIEDEDNDDTCYF